MSPFAMRIRELNGREEQSINGVDTANAARLAGIVAGDAVVASMTAGERDRLLAAIYCRTYGAEIRSTARCAVCGSLFDLDFSLEELASRLAARRRPDAVRLEDGTYRLEGSIRFRIPTTADELAVSTLPVEEAESALLALSILEGAGTPGAADRVASALEALSPVVSLQLEAACAECGSRQGLRFDLQEYLLRRLMGERRQLLAEVHRLATAYGWSLSDILSLSRSDRRALSVMVEAEWAAARRLP
jgi:hypothetical protein